MKELFEIYLGVITFTAVMALIPLGTLTFYGAVAKIGGVFSAACMVLGWQLYLEGSRMDQAFGFAAAATGSLTAIGFGCISALIRDVHKKRPKNSTNSTNSTNSEIEQSEASAG